VSRGWNEDLLAAVAEQLGRGVPQGTVVKVLADEFTVERRVVKRAIAEVFRRWGERMELSPETTRAELVGMALNLYGETRRLGHHKSALAALDLLSKLLGLTRAEAQPIALAVLDRQGALSSPEEVRARLAELRQRQLGAPDDEGDGGASTN
jgi:hypothetical protein